MIEKDRRYLANKGKIIKDALAHNKVNVIAVNSDAGMGKTTLLRYIRDTAVFPNIEVIDLGHMENNSETEISLTDRENTLFLLDEHPYVSITNLLPELKKIRKHNNKIIIFSHKKADIMGEVGDMVQLFIELNKEDKI